MYTNQLFIYHFRLWRGLHEYDKGFIRFRTYAGSKLSVRIHIPMGGAEGNQGFDPNLGPDLGGGVFGDSAAGLDP